MPARLRDWYDVPHLGIMRLGILLGFLVGAAIASRLITGETGEQTEPGGVVAEGEGFMAKLKRQANEARDAARQASEEKEAEMLREWEQTRHAESHH
jgi:hypothetical protein